MSPKPPANFFQSGEMPRLFGMLALLGVIGMLMYQSSKPETWRWLTGEREKEKATTSFNPEPSATASPMTPAAKPTPAEPTGPTDEDPEQFTEAQKEFQAISDRTLEMHVEEMAGYWRLFSWAENQTFGQMSRRAGRKFVFNDFVRDPDALRGQLFEIDLNVRRVLEVEAPPNQYGFKKLYEVVGFTQESQSWLYWGVTAHLPKGMPVGPSIDEKARFCGYFFKIQGYLPGGANAKRLPMPLLIGRMNWTPPPARPAEAEPVFGGWWVWLIGGGIAAVGVFRLFLPALFGAASPAPPSAAGDDRERTAQLGQWLAGEQPEESWEVPEEPWRESLRRDDHSDDPEQSDNP